MARFLVLTTFTSQEARERHRAEHRTYLKAQADAGSLLMAGPFDDVSGGLIVIEAESIDEVQAIMDADPFTTGGVFASMEIKPFTVVAGS